MRDITEVRFTLADSTVSLVYNYFFNRWDYFTNLQADSCALWQGSWTVASNSGVVSIENGTRSYDTTVSGGTASYSLYVETPWLKLRNVQDFQRIYSLMFLGEYLSPHTLTIRVQYDYDTSQTGTYTFNATQVLGQGSDSVYEFLTRITRQKCEAIKISFTETPGTGSQQSLIINDVSAVVGLKRGLNKLKPGKQI